MFVCKQKSKGWTPVALPLTQTACGSDLAIGINANGAINALSFKGKSWADANHTLGAFHYVTFSQADFDEFAVEWNNLKQSVILAAFCKVGYFNIHQGMFAYPLQQKREILLCPVKC